MDRKTKKLIADADRAAILDTWQRSTGEKSNYLFRFDGMVVPAPRMNKGQQHKDERAARYLSIKTELGLEYRNQMQNNGWVMFPSGIPLYIAFDLTVPRSFVDERGLHYCDYDNLIKAIQDAANRIVFYDDMFIDQCLGFRRRLGDAWQTLVRIGVLNDQ